MTRLHRHGRPPMPRDAAMRRPHGLRLAMLAAAWFALAWQGLVVQAHVHPRASAAVTAPGTRIGARDEAAPDCPLCQGLAQAGALLLPAIPALPGPAADFAPPAATAPRPFPPRTRPHGWLGRGPPPRS